MSDRRLLESVADAVAAGDVVDWPEVERQATKSRDADLLRQLKVVSAIEAGCRSHAARSPTWWSRLRENCVTAVLCVAVAQLALAILGAPPELLRVAWLHVVNLAMFGVAGMVLLAGGGRDARLPLLGGLFVIIGSAFAATLVPSPDASLEGVLFAVFRPLRPEAFLPLMLWRFVRRFPVDVQPGGARRVSNMLVDVSFGVGTVLFAINASTGYCGSPLPAWSMGLADLLDRNDAESAYWPLLFAIAAPAIPFVLWKARLETHENRRRVTLFVSALAVGMTPFAIAVVATPFVPALRDVLVVQRVGVVLYGALALIAPATAYSVSVDRVMDLRFLIRTTLQHSLARYAVWGVCVGPIAYVGLDLYANQQLTVGEYLERPRPAGPLVVSAVGLVALAYRQHLVRAIDRWYHVEPADHSQTLARLERRCRRARSHRGLTEALATELRAALHASSVAVLLLNDDRTEFVPVQGTSGPIRSDSRLLEVLRSTRGDVPVGPQVLDSISRLLSPSDREWLDDAAPYLLSLLVGSTGGLLGLVAIGAARTGLPYSEPHLALVTAACGRAAMQIENRRLRGRDADRSQGWGDPATPGRDWQSEPAMCCPACFLVWGPETRQCSCGTATTVAALPLFIQRKFRLERLIGTGGMGVVYLADDVVLDRKVAIKTLPSFRSESIGRLHREARTMAKVLHPNLALIYGTEQWQDTPMLVVEYLDGGTLRDRIRRGPVSYASALDLGIVLSDVLECVHAAGVLHRDVKPSNIGYTADGRPKLLDFGLALLEGRRDPCSAPEALPVHARDVLGRSTDPGATVTVGERLVGTPLYLAPEALAGVPPHPSFDLWGLALVLYEALAGRNPFAAEDSASVLAAVERAGVPDMRDYRPTCPAALAGFFRDALSRSVSRRPGSAGTMRSALRELRSSVQEPAH